MLWGGVGHILRTHGKTIFKGNVFRGDVKEGVNRAREDKTFCLMQRTCFRGKGIKPLLYKLLGPRKRNVFHDTRFEDSF